MTTISFSLIFPPKFSRQKTYLFLAPEIIMNSTSNSQDGNRGYGKEVDMWSLGAILYVL